MAVVRTVLGDVDPSEIGVTSMHEHVFIDARTNFANSADVLTIEPIDPDAPVTIDVLGALHRDPRILRDNLILDDEDLAVEELLAFKNGGGNCIVEVTNIGLFPRPDALARVAKRTGLHIVAGCSFYVERSHPEYVKTMSVEELGAMIASAVTAGIEGTEVRAGIIGEVGTSTLTPQEQKVLHASARAHLDTGAAITIHTGNFCREGERIVHLLHADGVAADRIILGHMDENMIDPWDPPNLAHLDYHRRVLDMGAWVEYDTFGCEWYWDGVGDREPTDSERIAGLAALIADGYEDQLLMAQDVFIKQCLRRYGGAGYGHVVRVVPRMLRQAGVSNSVIDKLLIHNPRRALAMPESA